MALKTSQKTFLKGAIAGAALMDWRKSLPLIVFGAFLCIAAFFMIFASTQIPEISRALKNLPLQTPEAVQNETGLVKIQGIPSPEKTLIEPITSTPVLYYHTVESEYKVQAVEKERTIQEESRSYTEKYTDYEAQWVVTKDETHWVNFSLGSIEVDPTTAQLLANTVQLHDETKAISVDLSQAPEALLDVPQQKRVTVEAVSVNEPVIVAGLLSEGEIRSGQGGLFVISNKTDGQLIEDERMKEENAQKAAFMGAWLFLTLGLFLICMPVVRILNIVPGMGIIAGMVLFVLLGLLCGVFTDILYLVMQL